MKDQVNTSRIIAVLEPIIRSFPAKLVAGQLTQLERFAYNIDLVYSRKGEAARVCDVGGGWGAFSLGCAAMGMDAVLVDDFRDPGFFDEATMEVMNGLYERFHVNVISRDVVAEGVDFAPATLDAVTSFDSMEHWHHSPKRLFHSLREGLKPDGLFVLGTPNCANLRKRIEGILGRAKWTQMGDWYEQERFRGHVREPDVEDLRYIALDLGLRAVEIHGRNWSGYYSSSALVQRLTRVTDPILQRFPSLCSDIYLVAAKA